MNMHCVHFVSKSASRLLCLTTKEFFHVFLARSILCVLVKAWGIFKPMLCFSNKYKEVATSQQGELSLFSCFLAKKNVHAFVFFNREDGPYFCVYLERYYVCVCVSVFFCWRGKRLLQREGEKGCWSCFNFVFVCCL